MSHLLQSPLSHVHLLHWRAERAQVWPRHSRHLAGSVAAVWAHIPHSLPKPRPYYPPLHPSYLETSRMSREMDHL